MYTKVTPKAGQNGRMWLYAGFCPIFLPTAVTKSYATFSMMVVGYITKLQARFVLRMSPFQVIPTPCRWTQKRTSVVRRNRKKSGRPGPVDRRTNHTGDPPGSWGPLLHPPLESSRKRTRGNGTRAAVRPPGPEKWSHRLGHPT